MSEPANQRANTVFGDYDGDVRRSYEFVHKVQKKVAMWYGI
jgi:hypothetical protein